MDNISKKFRTWIEIDTLAIKHNFDIFRGLLKPEVKLLAAVKSNAWGHDIVQFAKEMQKLGTDYIGVDDAYEAKLLREQGITKPILIFGYIEEEMLPTVLDLGVAVTVSNFNMLERVVKLKDKNPVFHIKVDTGLGRQGFLEGDMERVVDILKEQNLVPEGLYTHFSVAEDPAHIDYTRGQVEKYKKWVTYFNDNGFNPIRHTSATSGAIWGEELHFDMVRVGIGLYGLWCSQELKEWDKGRLDLRPIMEWKTIIGEVKDLPKGSFVGYNLRKELERDSRVAIIPTGYWHGLTGIASNKGEVVVRGKRAPIIGRVAMDMCILDVTDIPGVEVGDIVNIIGCQDGVCVNADEIKYRLDMINYEFVTRINPQIPRIYK